MLGEAATQYGAWDTAQRKQRDAGQRMGCGNSTSIQGEWDAVNGIQ